MPVLKTTQTPWPKPLVPEAHGIHQSDIIIRTALLAAIQDLRANPQLLDMVFSSLPRDSQTQAEYGEKSVDSAKQWFMKTDIPVSMVPRIDEGKWPRITISLADSSEFENTLGDVHYEPVEFSNTGVWPALTTIFTPIQYNPQTGLIVLPSDITDNLIVVPGMYIVDKAGDAFQFLKLDESGLYITPNSVIDLTNAVIKGVQPMSAVHMESATFKETYHIGLHVGQEPVYLTYLHSIIVFALLRYRQQYEARGFERSSFSSSDFIKDEGFQSELVFSRYITISGVVRNYWPKAIVSTINSVSSIIRVNPADKLPTGPNDVTKDNALWVGQNDDLNKDGIG